MHLSLRETRGNHSFRKNFQLPNNTTVTTIQPGASKKHRRLQTICPVTSVIIDSDTSGLKTELNQECCALCELTKVAELRPGIGHNAFTAKAVVGWCFIVSFLFSSSSAAANLAVGCRANRIESRRVPQIPSRPWGRVSPNRPSPRRQRQSRPRTVVLPRRMRRGRGRRRR